jgi:hypothetical protein
MPAAVVVHRVPDAVQMSNQHQHIDERLRVAAETDPILAYMIKYGMPLNRQTWMDLNYGSDVPTPWTAELEGEVPRPWRHGSEEV